jgi:starch-binding outer membrane protein, SusD/RagB family
MKKSNSAPVSIGYSKFVLVASLLLIAAFFSSCDFNVLDTTPTDSYTDEVIWDDEALVEAFANYAYRMLPVGFARTGRILPYSYMIDEANSRDSWSSIGTIIMGNHGPSYSGPMNVWEDSNDRPGYWTPINQANEFLEKIGDSTINPDIADRIAAEMRVVRAYAYFRLISHYGGVPLITSTFALDDDFRVTRDSYDDVMNFVISELDAAMNSLPFEYDSANKGRLTRGAAMAIKARALLYAASPLNNPENNMQKWEAARDAAKAVIDLNQYGLFDDYQVLFTEAGGYNEEVIWGRPTNVVVDSEFLVERFLFPNGWAGFGHVHPIQNLIDDFETVNGLLPKDDPDYDPQNPYVDRDPRFYATILYDGAPFKERTIETFMPGGLDTPDGIESAWNSTETSYYVRKFVDESKCGCTSSADGSSSPTWLRYRYAEVLLNYAEASFMLGDEATAREYVNMVRSRPSVNMPPVTESGEALWDRIVNERRIELVFESHRFFDVRRWKIAEDVLSQHRYRMNVHKDPGTGDRTFTVEEYQPANFNEWNYLAPIPQNEIDRNSMLEQNPGY